MSAAAGLLGATVYRDDKRAGEEAGEVVRVIGRWTVLVRWASGVVAPATVWGTEEIEHATRTSEG